ncbi:hypothetical protein [Microvirga flavescens]|uniref:hypothetical protein n=1 Tax=Microvirga flavescens TaxID=2249811 RepID=UPI00130059D9|nr:hypothetical protein [Microvirga flavescens]
MPELREQLELTTEQRSRMQELFETMKVETIPIGKRLIAQEAELDRQFSERTVTTAILTSASAAIGATQRRFGAPTSCVATLRRSSGLIELYRPQ